MAIPTLRPSFMDRKNKQFCDLTGALQIRHLYHELCKEGVGTVVKHAPIDTEEEEEEDTLWRNNIIGEHSPLAVQRAVFSMLVNVSVFRVGKSRGI